MTASEILFVIGYALVIIAHILELWSKFWPK